MMGEGIAVSLVWLLALTLIVFIIASVTMFLLGLSVLSTLHALNLNVSHWRAQFGRTFQYMEEDDDISGMFGDEEQEAR